MQSRGSLDHVVHAQPGNIPGQAFHADIRDLGLDVGNMEGAAVGTPGAHLSLDVLVERDNGSSYPTDQPPGLRRRRPGSTLQDQVGPLRNRPQPLRSLRIHFMFSWVNHNSPTLAGPPTEFG